MKLNKLKISIIGYAIGILWFLVCIIGSMLGLEYLKEHHFHLLTLISPAYIVGTVVVIFVGRSIFSYFFQKIKTKPPNLSPNKQRLKITQRDTMIIVSNDKANVLPIKRIKKQKDSIIIEVNDNRSTTNN